MSRTITSVFMPFVSVREHKTNRAIRVAIVATSHEKDSMDRKGLFECNELCQIFESKTKSW